LAPVLLSSLLDCSLDKVKVICNKSVKMERNIMDYLFDITPQPTEQSQKEISSSNIIITRS